MEEIRKQVARARRRLSTELLLQRLVKCWLVAFAIAALAIAVPKVISIASLPERWGVICLASAAVGGALAAILWTALRGRTELEAAMEIDRRFDLKERVASSLSLPEEALATPAGQALLADAGRAIGRLAIDERFRIRLGRSAWLPLGPALVALCLALFVDNQVARSSIDPATAPLSKEQLDNSTKDLRKRLVEQRKEAAKKGLKDAEQMLLELEKKTEKIADRASPDRKQALVKLNDLKKELDQRRQALGGDEQVKKQLAGMKDMNKGPADKMVDAMKNGDWQQAKQELDKLREQVASGKLDEAGKKQLEKQVAQLRKKLEEAAEKHSQAMEDLKKQIAEQRKKGNLDEAGKLQQKLDEMAKKSAQNKQLEKMAGQLKQMEQGLKQGGKAASQAMQDMANQLDQMQKQADESQMLDMAMDQLEQTKSSMTCKECNGKGCSQCKGGNSISQSMKPGNSNRMGKPGLGRGGGARDEQRNATSFRDSQVKQNPGRGAAVISGEADGPTIRGEVQAQVSAEMAGDASKPADPQVIEQLPKAQRENAEDYFNRFRDGN